MSRRNLKGELDPSVAALVGKYEHIGDPEVLIRKLSAEALALAYDGPPTVSDLPIDLNMVASFAGATVEEFAGGPSGSVRHTGNGYVIRLSLDDNQSRRKFSLAHEISHLPFLAASGEIERKDEDSIGHFDWSNQEEYLCDIGAAELAMPASAVSPLIPAQPTMAHVELIARACGTSVESTARRVVQLSGLPGCLVVLTTALKPVELRNLKAAEHASSLFPELEPAPPKERLRVKYATGPGPHIPKHKSVSDDSPLFDVCRGIDQDFTGFTGLIDEPLVVSARYMPFRHEGTLVPRVVAIVFEVGPWKAAARRTEGSK